MPTLIRQGITFHYVDSANSGLPFVLQHGLGGDCTQPIGLFTPPDWLRLICLDCRGNGLTEPLGPAESLGFATYADDVLALLDSLTIQHAIVGGISMGGYIAMVFGAKYPELCMYVLKSYFILFAGVLVVDTIETTTVG